MALFLATALAVVLDPPAASAALKLTVESVTLDESPKSTFIQPIEVFFQETAPVVNENLASYSVRAVLGNGGTGVAFVPPGATPTGHPWVFPAGTTFTDFQSSATVVQVAADADAGVNVDNNEGVLRIAVRIPAGTPAGTYPITIDTTGDAGLSPTTFVNTSANPIGFTVQNGGITIGGAPYLVADANGDGRVDVSDLGILATNFNKSPPSPPGKAGGDFNGDGTVNVADLGILATNFNQSLPAGTPTSPATIRLSSPRTAARPPAPLFAVTPVRGTGGGRTLRELDGVLR